MVPILQLLFYRRLFLAIKSNFLRIGGIGKFQFFKLDGAHSFFSVNVSSTLILINALNATTVTGRSRINDNRRENDARLTYNPVIIKLVKII